MTSLFIGGVSKSVAMGRESVKVTESAVYFNGQKYQNITKYYCLVLGSQI